MALRFCGPMPCICRSLRPLLAMTLWVLEKSSQPCWSVQKGVLSQSQAELWCTQETLQVRHKLGDKSCRSKYHHLNLERILIIIYCLTANLYSQHAIYEYIYIYIYIHIYIYNTLTFILHILISISDYDKLDFHTWLSSFRHLRRAAAHSAACSSCSR